jgi:hypothetical protein
VSAVFLRSRLLSLQWCGIVDARAVLWVRGLLQGHISSAEQAGDPQ